MSTKQRNTDEKQRSFLGLTWHGWVTMLGSWVIAIAASMGTRAIMEWLER